MNDVLVESSAVTALTKVVVDLLKISRPEMPSWSVVVAVAVASHYFTFLVAIAQGEIFTQQMIANNMIKAVLAVAGAMALTEAQKVAERKRAKAKREVAADAVPRPMTEISG